MTISFSSSGKIVSQHQADVSVSVTCAPFAPQTDGSVSVSLTQQSGSKVATGTGLAPITCDGQSHSDVVSVMTVDGRWHNGPVVATASAVAHGWHSTTTCTTSNGVLVCDISVSAATDSGSAGPATVTLTTD